MNINNGENTIVYITVPGFDNSFLGGNIIVVDPQDEPNVESRTITIERTSSLGTPTQVKENASDSESFELLPGTYIVTVNRLVSGEPSSDSQSVYMYGVDWETTPRLGKNPLSTSHRVKGFVG